MCAGRKKAITKEELLDAIREYATTSPSELAKKLEIDRTTIWRRMQEVTQEEIDKIFKDLADFELKPYQMKYETFLQIPTVLEYQEKLKAREVSPERYSSNLRTLWHFCVYLKRNPEKLTIEECAKALQKLKVEVAEKKVQIEHLKAERKSKEARVLHRQIQGLGFDSLRTMIRSWFENKGVSGELLTSYGISGELGKGFGSRAHDRLTVEERHRFLEALKEVTNADPFYMTLPKWLYYTGTRIEASLQVTIENITWNGVGKAFVVDKGKHKKGREKWYKLIIGELRTELQIIIGDRKEGLVFNGLKYDDVLAIFRIAYEKAGIKVHQPCHIWRHTSAQDLLDATDWNYELVASILGWKDTRTLKLCYGAMGESARERALRRAMGESIPEERKEFKF